MESFSLSDDVQGRRKRIFVGDSLSISAPFNLGPLLLKQMSADTGNAALRESCSLSIFTGHKALQGEHDRALALSASLADTCSMGCNGCISMDGLPL